MLPASNRLGGQVIGAPDVCLTPIMLIPVPIPYVNLALNVAASVFSPTVIICGGNALTVSSVLAMSSGDEPGTLHWTIMGPATFTSGFPKVLINGLPAAMLTSQTLSNNGNCTGVQVVPSATNVLYACASESVGAAASPVRYGPVEEDGAGRVAIDVFTSDVPARVHAAISALERAGARAIVLDLRGNPGGEIAAAIELAGCFLEPGSVVATLVDDDGDEVVHRTWSERPCRLPLTVLIDGGTASAAELVAGCLQAHGRAVVAGERSYGKGAVELLAPARARVARFLRPDGEEVDAVGIRPDTRACERASA